MTRITDRRYRKFRIGILLRDARRCRYRYPGCTLVATQVDHLVPRHPFGGGPPGGVYDEENCFSVCHSCHREKERRERAGEPLAVFKEGNPPEMRRFPYTHTGSTRVPLLNGDYSRRRARRGDAAS